MMRPAALFALAAVLLISACDVTVPAWMGGPQPPMKRAPGERVSVIVTQPKLEVDEASEPFPIEVPDQVGNDTWLTRNQAMGTSHIGLTGINESDSARIGEGYDFSRTTAPAPVITEGRVFAMDAAGAVSAHDEKDISDVIWVNEDALVDDIDDVLGGGLAANAGVVYATTGYGTLLAIDATTGKTKWKTKVGAPVRGAPCYADGLVFVLSADNQTLAFTAETGAPRWSHRGIRESAGYFATTSPVVSDGIVIAAYTSGEIFALRAETGSALWSDSVSSQVKTRASAVFSGIDADPLVQDGVVVVMSAGGVMQASALLNGRPLWQQKIGGHQTPWSAGNAIFLISDTHDIAALIKRNGAVRWATSLAETDGLRDTTPPLYGPILAGNAVMVVDTNGYMRAFKPQDGKLLGEYELADGIITPPVIANGALYLVTKDATLHKYY